MIRNEEQIMFVKENFVNDGPYLRYRTADAPYGRVVARFKHGSKGFITKANVKQWLIKSGIDQDVYFHMLVKEGIAPIGIIKILDRDFYDAKREAWNRKQIEKYGNA